MNNIKLSVVGFLVLLTIIFVIAKITNLITWSWWLIFLPVLLPLAVCIILVFVSGIAQIIKK